jgi:CBS domain-containing protein
MLIRDVMTENVLTVHPEASIFDVARLMRDEDIGAVPVAENDRLIGMVTDRDIVVRALADLHFKFGTRARAVMSEKLFYCFADQEVDDVRENMTELQVRRMPVVDRDKRLVGIVTLSDLSDKSPQSTSGDGPGRTFRPLSH